MHIKSMVKKQYIRLMFEVEKFIQVEVDCSKKRLKHIKAAIFGFKIGTNFGRNYCSWYSTQKNSLLLYFLQY